MEYVSLVTGESLPTQSDRERKYYSSLFLYSLISVACVSVFVTVQFHSSSSNANSFSSVIAQQPPHSHQGNSSTYYCSAAQIVRCCDLVLPVSISNSSKAQDRTALQPTFNCSVQQILWCCSYNSPYQHTNTSTTASTSKSSGNPANIHQRIIGILIVNAIFLAIIGYFPPLSFGSDYLEIAQYLFIAVFIYLQFYFLLTGYTSFWISH